MRNPTLLAAAALALLSPTLITAQAASSSPALRLHNVVTGRSEPLRDKFFRVEMPALFTLEATAPAGTASAAFEVDGKVVRVDNQAPFLLSEDAGQKATAWETAGGEWAVRVKFYPQPDAKGTLLAQQERKFSISTEGMGVMKTPATEAEQDAWLEQNLDNVLQKKTFTASNGLAMPYRIFLPPNYSAQVKYPLVIYLHGRGQRGTDNGPRVYNGGLFRGRRSIVSPTMQQTFPSIVIVPQCSDKTTNEEWAKWVGNSPQTPFQGLGKDGSYTLADEPSDSGKAVLELIEATIAQHSVDPKRVYLTGVSMGGFGTWEYVSRRPELFAAAIPMAGYSDVSKVERFSKIPFWIFHGNADESNPVQGSRTLYAALQKAGADVRYTEYPDTKHGDSFRKAWAEVELLPWIFAQRRN